MGGTVLLVAFYNGKALGVRYLSTALERAGHRVVTVFLKEFNSAAPSPVTRGELDLLCEKIEETSPVLIGFSVMSSMYLDTVDAAIQAVQSRFSTATLCGGAYATMFPERFLAQGVNFVIRSDGEGAICQLAGALTHGSDFRAIPSLCWREDGQDKCNPIDAVLSDLDGYGLPAIGDADVFLIEGGRLVPGDPMLRAYSYEVVASRGCPFTCSYCCCVNLRRLLPKGIPPVRTRSVDSVLEELLRAKKQCRRLAVVHFYDEIFPDLPGWIDEFVRRYPGEIGLPFVIWSHPKALSADILQKLVGAGLVEVIMGIQSGSEHIRRDIFHRYESNRDIIESVGDIHRSGVFWASYDFMLQHPFETLNDLKQSYFLVKELEGRFELQLHGLNFLPGTDIVPMALERGYYTPAQMEDILYAPMERQFGAYWKQENDMDSQLWYAMIYLWQFPLFRRACLRYETEPFRYQQAILRDYRTARMLFRLRYLYKKARVLFKSKIKKRGVSK